MSEDQGKPERLYKKLSSEVSKHFGFILLFFLVAVIIVYAWANSYDYKRDPEQHAYNAARDHIQNEVLEYISDNNKNNETDIIKFIPLLNSTYTNANCSDCSVINFSALLTANGGYLRDALDGLNLSASGNDNCGGDAGLGCSNNGSYIWIVHAYGELFSYCAGAGCTTNNSGYQDVWP